MTDTTRAAPPALELSAGALRLALRPDLGGSLAGLWHDGLAVLRSSEPAGLASPRQSASFALVPYSNRLGFRRFRWQGRDHTTEPNWEEPSAHSLHGTGWQRAWQVEGHAADRAVLAYRHAPDGHWPFAFDAEQRITLTPDALRLDLAVTNRDPQPQPVGLGWHPYFPKRARSRLHVECSERWVADAGTQLPTRKAAQPGIDAEVRHLDFDNCFEGWRGAARIRDEKFALKLTSSLGWLVVFTPPERDFFCVEPVSHVSNAIHMADPLAHGLKALAPGERFEAWMTLEVARA